MQFYLSKAAVYLSMMIVMLLASCGEDQEYKSDTVDSLVDEMIGQVNRLPDAMLSIKDKESAQQAAEVINQVAGELEGIAKRLEKLPEPSEEEKKRIGKKIKDATREGDEKIRTMDASVMADPEIMKITKDAMTSFMEKMKKPEEIFKKYGKGSE